MLLLLLLRVVRLHTPHEKHRHPDHAGSLTGGFAIKLEATFPQVGEHQTRVKKGGAFQASAEFELNSGSMHGLNQHPRHSLTVHGRAVRGTQGQEEPEVSFALVIVRKPFVMGRGRTVASLASRLSIRQAYMVPFQIKDPGIRGHIKLIPLCSF